MLAGLIALDWGQCNTGSFRERFLEWEVAVQRYESQSADKLSDSLKVAIVSRHAPAEVRAAIRTHITFIGTSYSRLRVMVNEFLVNGLGYDSYGVLSHPSPPAAD